jgi:predicted pyridoxine 5'-phosphate oxidase superfamily flavin-nucleotide-binding protein
MSDSEAETFHAGERALQARAGVAERLARLGPQVIRDHMPEQHRDFFAILPFIIVGSIDDRDQPTASLLAAPPGFVSSPDPKTLRIDALARQDDPLHENLRPGAPLAVLGIQPHTRRRNRANGSVLARDDRGFAVDVRQSFGNCPKYIHPREVTYVGAGPSSPPVIGDGLGSAERALIRGADTFFIASAHPEARAGGARAHGVDVSHRGGPPGFAHFTGDDTFIIPDFRGNSFFNTLGNLHLHPKAGLLFIDPTSGDVLELEVTTQTLAGDHPLAGPEYGGRVVCFIARRARRFRAASPLHFRTLEAAANG